MTNKEALDLLTIASQNMGAEIGKLSSNKEALDTALALIASGYQSDQLANQEAIATGIAEGIDAAVKEATAPLTEQIAALSDQVAEPPTT